MEDGGPEEISRLIEEWRAGSGAAEQRLFEALYRKLYSIAVVCLRGESPGQTLGATALVHEAYLRLRRSERLSINDRNHFLQLCARVMRRILVDRARARRAQRRDADTSPEGAVQEIICGDKEADQILDIDRALNLLARDSPRQSALVELRYFAGYSTEECAAILDISERTVKREWQIARTRLRDSLDGRA